MKNEELNDTFNEEDEDLLIDNEESLDDNSQVQSSNLENINNSSLIKNNYLLNKNSSQNLDGILNKNHIRENIQNTQAEFNNASQMQEKYEASQNDTKSSNILKQGGGLVSSKMIAEASADPILKKELADIILKKMLASKVLIVVGIATFIILFLVIIVLIMFTLKDDQSEVNTSKELIGVIKGDMTIDEITNYLVYMDICREMPDDNEEKVACAESGFAKFLLKFGEVYKGYLNYLDKEENPIEIDIPLILETISYDRSDNDLVEILNDNSGYNTIVTELHELSQAQVEHIQEYGDYYYYSNGQCYLKKDQLIGKPYYRISDDKYISYLKYGKVHENYSNKVRMYDAVIHPESTDKCIPEDMGYSPPSTIRYVGKEVVEDASDNDTTNNENNNVEGSGIGTEIANYALQFVGNPYVWGGTSLTNGADCSGFTMKIFQHFGVTLPHYSLDQAKYGKNIGTDVKNAIPGDLIVYKHQHVAIYIGNNKIVHAASAKTGIKVSNKADYKSILSIRRLVE